MTSDHTPITRGSEVVSSQIDDLGSNDRKTYSVTIQPMTAEKFQHVFGTERDSRKFGSGVSVKWPDEGVMKWPYEDLGAIAADLDVTSEAVTSAWITGKSMETKVPPTFVPYKNSEFRGQYPISCLMMNRPQWKSGRLVQGHR